MLNLLKRNDIVVIVFLLLMGFLMKLYWILHPPAIHELSDFDSSLLMRVTFLRSFYAWSPRVYLIFSIFYLIALSLWLNFMLIKHRLFQSKNYIPSFSILLFTSLNPLTSIFSLKLLAITLLLRAMFRIMDMYQQADAARQIVHVGLLVSFAVLLFFPSILFVPLFILSIFTMKTLNMRDMLAYAMGLLLPFYFVLGIGFLISGKEFIFSKVSWGLYLPTDLSGGIYTPIIILYLICLMVYAFYLLANENSRSNMAIKKKWSVFYQVFLSTFILGFCSPSFPGISWIVNMLPISIILSKTFMSDKQKVNTFTLYATLSLLIIIQWFQAYFK